MVGCATMSTVPSTRPATVADWLAQPERVRAEPFDAIELEVAALLGGD